MVPGSARRLNELRRREGQRLELDREAVPDHTWPRQAVCARQPKSDVASRNVNSQTTANDRNNQSWLQRSLFELLRSRR